LKANKALYLETPGHKQCHHLLQLLEILPYASCKRKMSEVAENLMKPLRSEHLHQLLICLVCKGPFDPTILLLTFTISALA
jgi:hypothetical protein